MEILTQLKGVNFRGAEIKQIVENLDDGAELRLEREPTNVYDTNAIKVYDTGFGEFIGYIAKEGAAELAQLMDAGAELEAVVHSRQGPTALTISVTVEDDEASEGDGIEDEPDSGPEVA